MNIEKLLKLCKGINDTIGNTEERNNVIQEFANSIHPEKYITKQTVLKLIERDKQKKNTNVENIKDEDKLIAYMFIERTLGLCINVIENVLPLLKCGIYSGGEIFKELYLKVGIKYQSLIFNIYDEVNNFHNRLSIFSNKYPCYIWTNKWDGSKHLCVKEPDHLRKDGLQFDYDNLDKLIADLSRLYKKLEEWFEFRNKIYKEEQKYKDLYKELEKDPLFVKKEDIHDIQYEFSVWFNSRSQWYIEYQIYLCQKYHEKRAYLINIEQSIHFNNDEYISKLDNIKINDLVDNIKLTNGKPYEYEITIENLPSSQYLMDSTSSAIKRVISKDGSIRDGNFYELTKQIDENIALDITDSYVMTQDRNNCGQGRMGIVMSIFYFDQDFDIHNYLSKLKTLYYENVERYQCSLSIASKEDFYAAFDNAEIKNLGQSNKEIVKLI